MNQITVDPDTTEWARVALAADARDRLSLAFLFVLEPEHPLPRSLDRVSARTPHPAGPRRPLPSIKRNGLMARQLKNLLVNRIHDRRLETLARQYLAGSVVDVGCGTKPYRSMLKPFVTRHLGIDHPASPHDPSDIDIAATAYALPIRSGAVDGALCTAVLEHLEEPGDAVRECLRILKPGGIAIYSVPFIWHPHEEPRDFYRYTEHGLAYLMTKAGFETVEIIPLAGFWVTFGQLFAYYLARLDRGIIRRLRLLVPAYLIVQAAAYGLDRLDRAEQWTWAYMAVVRRPAD